MQPMLIALDYDGTYTADPSLWLAFIEKARGNGHSVWVVTMRYEEELGDVKRQLGDKVNLIVATSRKAKRAFLSKRGIIVDIWIDDNPQFIIQDSADLRTSDGGVLIFTD